METCKLMKNKFIYLKPIQQEFLRWVYIHQSSIGTNDQIGLLIKKVTNNNYYTTYDITYLNSLRNLYSKEFKKFINRHG
jgi:hypothetical protein